MIPDFVACISCIHLAVSWMPIRVLSQILLSLQLTAASRCPIFGCPKQFSCFVFPLKRDLVSEPETVAWQDTEKTGKNSLK